MLNTNKQFRHFSKSALLLMVLIVGGFLFSGTATTAFADTPGVNGSITAGSLSETASSLYNFTGTPGSISTYTMPFSADDLTGSGAGWSVSITSTTLTSGPNTLPNTASTITGTTATCTTSGTCSGDTLTNATTGVIGIPGGTTAPTPVKFFGTPIHTGSGTYSVTPTISVVIPGGTLVGTYSSTVTLAISSGP